MRSWRKVLAVAVVALIMALVGYIGYLWASYIDETVVSGTAYGFTIGTSKQQTLKLAGNLDGHPQAVVYVSYGPRAGDNFSVAPLPESLKRLQAHDQWDLLLDGEAEFFNSVRLTFANGRLVEIYRHRQRFELP